MDVDRRTRRFLDGLRNEEGNPVHMSTPAEVRRRHRGVMEANGSGPAMQRVIDESVPTADGHVPLRVLVPVPIPRAVIVYYHGGGWVSGSIAETETIARKLAERTSSTVVLVDYRLAPENPYPAAVDDSYAALQWAADHLHEIAGEDVPLMVAGDDAGGTLAAVVTMLARDRNGPTISTHILICPTFDSSAPDSAGAEADDAGWVGPSALRWYWDQYVPDPTARAAAGVTPLEASDLSELPPTVIVTAEYSPARVGAETYAQRLRDAGVDVDEQMYEGQVHNFAVVLSIPLGERVFQQVIRTVRGRWARARRNTDMTLKTMEESKR